MSIFAIPPDIIKTHILTKLDGATLACAAAASPFLRAEEKLCTELISVIDIRYKNNVIYSDMEESDDFLCVDILHSKKLELLPVNFEDFSNEQMESISLSWILIDPTQNRSLNLSSNKPISSQRNYNPDHIKLLYVTILPNRVGLRANPVQCTIVVTCKGKEGGGMHVTGVKIQLEDIDGYNLSCEDSLVILQGAIQNDRMYSINQGNERKAFEEFLEMKRVRKERIERRDYMIDVICVIFRIFILFILLCIAFFCY